MSKIVGTGVHTEQTVPDTAPGTADLTQLDAGSQAPAL